MSDATILHEAGYRQGSRAVVPEGDGQRIYMRIMGWEPGSDVVEGSSADYPIKVIKRDFPEAFPIGTRSRANHDGFCDAGGDIRRLMAKSISPVEFKPEGAYYWARAREGDASDFLRQFADVIGTSVSVGVELEKDVLRDEDGEPVLDADQRPVMINRLSERGVPIVKRFLPMMESPYNAVDFVEAPGADGAIVQLAIESAKTLVEHVVLREAATFALDLAGDRQKDSEATPPRKNKKEHEMDKEERESLRDEIVASLTEALRPSTSTSQPTLGEQSEAVIAAGLTKEGRTGVYERVAAGTPLADAIGVEAAREQGIDAEVERRIAERADGTQRESVLDFGFTEDDKGAGLRNKPEAAKDQKAVDEKFDALASAED